MPQKIFPPGCVLDAFQLLLPGLRLNEVQFFVGIPWQVDKGQPAITLGLWSGPGVYLRDPPDFCQRDSFLLVAHELVHAFQIQQTSGSPVPGSWTFNYVFCWWVSGFTDLRGNCYEDEAYHFSNGDAQYGYPPEEKGRLLKALDSGLPLPCVCTQFGLPIASPHFTEFTQQVHAQGLQFTQTTCNPQNCARHLLDDWPVIGFIWSLIAYLAAAFAWLFTFGGINDGTIAGAVIVGLGGAAGGAYLGLLLGAVTAGVVGAVLGAILLGAVFGFLGVILGGFLGGLLQDLFDFIFGGDSGGALNLEFSADDGTTFTKKISFERTREQIALSLSNTTLFVGWTGLDAQVNVLAIAEAFPGNHSLKSHFEQSNHCGPAIAWDQVNNRLLVVWVGTEGHLNIRPVSIGAGPSLQPQPKTVLWGAKSPADATPGLVIGNQRIYLGWVEDPTGALRIWYSLDGVFFQNAVAFIEGTPKTGTAAIAFGNDRLFLAWVDFSNTLLVRSFVQQPDGSLAVENRSAVLVGGTWPQIMPGKTGPAIAFGHNRVFVTWEDPWHGLHCASSADGVNFTDHTFWPETGRGNAGPVVAYEGGVVAFGWTGQG